jgi:hypothetical protein
LCHGEKIGGRFGLLNVRIEAVSERRLLAQSNECSLARSEGMWSASKARNMKPYKQDFAFRPKPITKINAAQRQLDCAVRLFFESDDSLSIQTLSQAAFQILFDIYPWHRKDGFEKDLSCEIERMGWPDFVKAKNFLKHADRDPHEMLSQHSYIATMAALGFGAILYQRITGRYTPEMRAYDDYAHAMNPDIFQIGPDPDPEVERGYREAVARLRERPHHEQVQVGRGLLRFYREHPDHARLSPPVLDRPKK